MEWNLSYSVEFMLWSGTYVLVSCNLLVYVMEWNLCYGVEFMLGSGTKVME